MRTTLAVSVLAVAAAAGCAPEPAAPAAEPADRAAAAVRRLGSTLIDELTTAMEQGGPEGALHVCADVAQRISDEISAEEGFAVRRTALRVRNPANAPDAYERRVLESWAEADLDAVGPLVAVDDTTGESMLRWMRPIRLVGLCTQCHGAGDEISPATRAAIAERYPEDQATDFAIGELRGAFTVRIPVD